MLESPKHYSTLFAKVAPNFRIPVNCPGRLKVKATCTRVTNQWLVAYLRPSWQQARTFGTHRATDNSDRTLVASWRSMEWWLVLASMTIAHQKFRTCLLKFVDAAQQPLEGSCSPWLAWYFASRWAVCSMELLFRRYFYWKICCDWLRLHDNCFKVGRMVNVVVDFFGF